MALKPQLAKRVCSSCQLDASCVRYHLQYGCQEMVRVAFLYGYVTCKSYHVRLGCWHMRAPDPTPEPKLVSPVGRERVDVFLA